MKTLITLHDCLYLPFYPSCAVCQIEHSALVLAGYVVNLAMDSPFLFLCPTAIL